MDKSTYDYLQPSKEQIERMQRVCRAAAAFGQVLEAELPDGPGKTFTIRNHRATARWTNVAATRHPTVTPCGSSIILATLCESFANPEHSRRVPLASGWSCHAPSVQLLCGLSR